MRTLIDIQKGRCQAAIAAVDRVEKKGGNPLRSFSRLRSFTLSYHIASCYLEQGQPEKAIEALRRTRIKIRYYIPRMWQRPFLYPKSFYGLGQIYEQQGDKQLAIQNYEKFLDLWKDADEDLPDLIDAKERLAKLKENPLSE